MRGATTVAASLLAASTALAQPNALPGHARLLGASIEEHPSADAKALFARPVTIRLALAARPACDARGAAAIYALLIDAFPWQHGAARIPGFDELRFQSKLIFTCDPTTGKFSSSIPGDVAVEPADGPPGAHELVLRTRVGDLPAIEFRWIAVAAEGDSYTRAPAAGRFALWRIHERSRR